MERHLDKFFEHLANSERFNSAVIFTAIAVQGLCTIALLTASYFLGMRKGVDITDSYYA